MPPPPHSFADRWRLPSTPIHGTRSRLHGPLLRRRHPRKSLLTVEIHIHTGAGGADAVDGSKCSMPWLRDQPKAVAAETIHVGIDDRNSRRRHHGFDGITVIAKTPQSRFGRQVMRGGHHAAIRSQRLKHHSSPGVGERVVADYFGHANPEVGNYRLFTQRLCDAMLGVLAPGLDGFLVAPE